MKIYFFHLNQVFFLNNIMNFGNHWKEVTDNDKVLIKNELFILGSAEKLLTQLRSSSILTPPKNKSDCW